MPPTGSPFEPARPKAVIIGDEAPAPPRPTGPVRAEGAHLTDAPEPWIAVNNLSSLRAVGQRLGQELSIHRWRGNLWIEGLDLAPHAHHHAPQIVRADMRLGAKENRVGRPGQQRGGE